jgi:hypothetical protein
MVEHREGRIAFSLGSHHRAAGAGHLATDGGVVTGNRPRHQLGIVFPQTHRTNDVRQHKRTRFRAGAATWAGSGYVEGDTGLQHVQVGPTPITLTR